MFLFVAGISFKSGPLEHREHVSEHLDFLLRRLRALVRLEILSETVVIGTCNRIEVYGVALETISPDRLISRFFVDTHGPPFDEVKGSIYVYEGNVAVEHLMKVASGLDALVLGESQVLGQVREAFKKAQRSKSAGPVLSRLFAVALRWARKARQDSGLCRFAVSVAYAAVELARRIFGDISDIPVAVVGSGEMGLLALEQLKKSGTGTVMVLNRTVENARVLAEKFNGEHFGLDSMIHCLSRADVCITSTASPVPLITRKQVEEVMALRGGRPLFLLDLAVPRDIEPQVSTISSVYVYNVDDLQNVVSSNIEAREKAAHDAGLIYSEGMKEFNDWVHSRSVGPLMQALEEKVSKVVEKEFARLVNRISVTSQECEKIRLSMRKACRKLVHSPMIKIKHWSAEKDSEHMKKIALASELLDLSPLHEEELNEDE